jgi:hypothetical protein
MITDVARRGLSPFPRRVFFYNVMKPIESTAEKPTDAQRTRKALRVIAAALRRQAALLDALAGEAEAVGRDLRAGCPEGIKVPIDPSERNRRNPAQPIFDHPAHERANRGTKIHL